MKAVRVLASALVAALLAVVGVVAIATPARADVSNMYSTVYCQINNTGLGALSISTFTNWTITMSLAPANAASGATVTVTVASPQTPKNGPAVPLPAGGTQMEPVLDVSGTAVIAKSAPNAAAVPLNSDIFPGGWSATGTFPAPAAGGAYDVVLKKIVINSFSGSNTTAQTDSFDSNCAVDGDPSVAPFTPFNLTLPGNDNESSTPVVPTKPRSVTAVAGDTKASVSWLAPATPGGVISKYVVTSSPDGKTCQTSGTLTCDVTGLTNGTPYTFTVVATNPTGDSPASDPSTAVTPRAVTGPGAPTAVTATAGDAKATVKWTAPADNGGSALTGYTATSAPDGKTCSTAGAVTCDVPGLTNGTAYTFTVIARNAKGDSAASAASTAVTPAAAASPSPTPTPAATPVVVNGMKCEIFSGAAGTINAWEQASKNSTSQNSVPPSITFAASKLTVAAGDKVSLVLAFSQGPQSGPIALASGILQPKAKVTVGGAGSGTIVLTGSKYGDIAAYSWVPGTTITGTYTAAAAGAVTFTLAEFGFDYGDTAAGASFDYPTKVDDLDTVCNKGAKPKETPATIGLLAQEGASAVPELPGTLPTSNGPLTVTGATTAGSTVTLSGSGFKASGFVVAAMYSTPTALGQATASSAGEVSMTAVIPAGTSGQHTMVMYGVAASGAPFALTKTVTVTAASSASPTDDTTGTNDGTLPQTGPESAGLTLLWALVALQIGLIVAVRASRRRRPAAAGKHRR